MGSLALYVDLMSQPSRALVIFCRVNGIPFSQQLIQIGKGENRTEQFKVMFPLAKLPCMDDAGFRLSESHAILRYLVATRPCSDHWYPEEVKARAQVEMLLDWHHTNVRKGAAGWVFNQVLAPLKGLPTKEEVIADAKATLETSISTIEIVWLKEGGSCLLGAVQPSIADLSMVCELLQLQMLGQATYDKIFSSTPRVRQWTENVREALNPHFDDANVVLRAFVRRREKQAEEAHPSRKPELKNSAADMLQPYSSLSASSGRLTNGQDNANNSSGGPGAFQEGADMMKLYSPLSVRPGRKATGPKDVNDSITGSGAFPEGAEMGRLYIPNAISDNRISRAPRSRI